MAWNSALSVLNCIEEVSWFDCSSDEFVFNTDTSWIAEVALDIGSEIHVYGGGHWFRVAIKKLAMLLHKGLECSTTIWFGLLAHYFVFN